MCIAVELSRRGSSNAGLVWGEGRPENSNPLVLVQEAFFSGGISYPSPGGEASKQLEKRAAWVRYFYLSIRLVPAVLGESSRSAFSLSVAVCVLSALDSMFFYLVVVASLLSRLYICRVDCVCLGESEADHVPSACWQGRH